MMLSHIHAQGINGLIDFSYPLKPITIITGENATGKTAIANAVRIVLRGYHPGLGKLPSATFALGTLGQPLCVTGAFEPQGRIVREFKRKPDGAVSSSQDIKDVPETPAILMDFNEYLNMTGRERTDYVFKELQLADQDIIDQALAELAKLECVPSQKPVLDKLIGDIKAAAEKRVSLKQSSQEWLSKTIASITTAKKTAKQELKPLQELLVGLRKEGSQPVKDRRAEAEAIQKRRLEINNRLVTLKALVEEHDRLSAQTAAKETGTAEELEKQIIALGDPAKSLKTLEKELQEIRNAWSQATANKDHTVKELQVLMEAKTKLAEEKRCPHCNSASKGWKATLEKNIEEKIVAINANLATLNEDIAKHEAKGKTLAGQVKTAKENVVSLQSKQQALARIQGQANAIKRLAEIGTKESLTEEQTKLAAEEALALTKAQEVQVAVDAFARVEHQKTETVRIETKMAGLTATEFLCDPIHAALTKVQNDELSKSFGVLLEVANMFTVGLLKTPLCFNSNQEIGRMDGETFVTHKAFSGFEQRLSYAALSVALAHTAPFKLVIIDEMGTFRPVNKAAVIERFQELLKQKVIDQAILIGGDRNDYQPADNISFIEV